MWTEKRVQWWWRVRDCPSVGFLGRLGLPPVDRGLRPTLSAPQRPSLPLIHVRRPRRLPSRSHLAVVTIVFVVLLRRGHPRGRRARDGLPNRGDRAPDAAHRVGQGGRLTLVPLPGVALGRRGEPSPGRGPGQQAGDRGEASGRLFLQGFAEDLILHAPGERLVRPNLRVALEDGVLLGCFRCHSGSPTAAAAAPRGRRVLRHLEQNLYGGLHVALLRLEHDLEGLETGEDGARER